MRRIRGVASLKIIALEILLIAFSLNLYTVSDVFASTSSDLTPRYRLYNPNNGQHHYTTSEHEYNVLYTYGWIQEGIACYMYDDIASVDSVNSVPYYRLYNPNTGDHHWTTDLNEYTVLPTYGWVQEGVDGYVFGTAVTGSGPLYRLYNPNEGPHHWTMDLNERNVLVGYGWVDEGIACYVFASSGEAETWSLNVEKVSLSGGSGTITSSPSGINCGTDCTEDYPEGSEVTLTAAADSGSAFAGWTGCDSSSNNTCSITVDRDKIVTATFIIPPVTPVLQTYALTVQKQLGSTGTGTIESNPPGIDCGTDCTEDYDEETEVTLTATADSGSTFAGWTGCDETNENTCKVRMYQDRIVLATFGYVFNTSIKIVSLPLTDADGDYVLEWEVTGLASTSYRIEEDSDRSFSGPTYFYLVNAFPPYTYAFSGKDNGTYCYRVSFGGVVGPASDSRCVTVDRTLSKPATPSNLISTTLNLSEIQLDWNDNANNETEYRVWMSTTGQDGPFTKIGTLPQNSSSDPITDLRPCTSYWFKVQACQENNCSEFSNTVRYDVNYTAYVNVQLLGQASPLFPGTFWLGCWDQEGKKGAVGVYDSNSNGILDNEDGNVSYVFPRQPELKALYSAEWVLKEGKHYHRDANLVLYLSLDTWTTQNRPNYIALYLKIVGGTIYPVSMWAGDLLDPVNSIESGVAMESTELPAFGGSGSLPTNAELGFLRGQASGAAWFVSPSEGDIVWPVIYGAGIYINFNMPIYRDNQ